jgi:hypothetical protein
MRKIYPQLLYGVTPREERSSPHSRSVPLLILPPAGNSRELPQQRWNVELYMQPMELDNAGGTRPEETRKLTIFTDSQAAIRTVRRVDDHPRARLLSSLFGIPSVSSEEYKAEMNIRLIPAHIGNEAVHEADAPAIPAKVSSVLLRTYWSEANSF